MKYSKLLSVINKQYGTTIAMRVAELTEENTDPSDELSSFSSLFIFTNTTEGKEYWLRISKVLDELISVYDNIPTISIIDTVTTADGYNFITQSVGRTRFPVSISISNTDCQSTTAKFNTLSIERDVNGEAYGVDTSKCRTVAHLSNRVYRLIASLLVHNRCTTLISVGCKEAATMSMESIIRTAQVKFNKVYIEFAHAIADRTIKIDKIRAEYDANQINNEKYIVRLRKASFAGEHPGVTYYAASLFVDGVFVKNFVFDNDGTIDDIDWWTTVSFHKDRIPYMADINIGFEDGVCESSIYSAPGAEFKTDCSQQLYQRLEVIYE